MIELRGLVRTVGAFTLGPIDLKMPNGEYFVLLGPTGSGKSMTLSATAGFIAAENGRIFFGNTDVTELPPEKRRIGFVTQKTDLFPHLSVRENIGYGLRDKGSAKINALAEKLEITHLLGRGASGLSGGESQRVALARALAYDPQVILLDEPLGALDPAMRRAMRRILKRLHAEDGRTFLHVTHDFEEAASLADRVGVIMNGKLEQVSSVSDLFRHPANAGVAAFIGHKNILRGVVTCGKAALSHDDVGAQHAAPLLYTNGISLELPDDAMIGEAVYSIAPESIVILRDRISSSARNCIEGRIVGIERGVAVSHVEVNAGIDVEAMVTNRSIEEMKLEPGATVWIAIKSTSLHRLS